MKLLDLGIAQKNPAFIVAEISSNHGGNLETCLRLIASAKNAGANAVKFQTYIADSLTLNSTEPDFQLPNNSPWYEHKTLYELYQRAFTPWEWHEKLFEYAKGLGLIAFSSPFDKSAVDLLENLDCPIYKIASPEITHTPLIEQIAKTKKPVLISLGTAAKKDLIVALDIFKSHNVEEIVLMQCDTNYPASSEDANIRQISSLGKQFPFLTGYSDHTMNAVSSILAVAHGAKVFEKHLMLEKESDTVDNFFSLDSREFARYVSDIRTAEAALGNEHYRHDGMSSNPSQRSIYPKRDIAKGEKITEKNIGIFRPGLSLSTDYYSEILGKFATRSIKHGERISLSDFE